MRLNQIYVRQYGPVQKDLVLDGDINVIRGANESGKSLLVEALLKQLTDGSVPNSVISKPPEGFVEVSDGSRSETLQGGDSLSEFCVENFNTEISAEDLRNVFVIRRGDLSFREDDEFYSHITDKLTGRRVEDINEVRDALIDEGRLTSGRLNISSKQSFHNAANQLDEAKSLSRDIGEYLEKAEKNGIDQAESELFGAKQKESELDQRVKKLERAKEEEEKQRRYDELVQSKNTIEKNLEELENLPDSSELDDIDRRLEELSSEEGQESELRDQKESNLTLAKWSIGASVGAFGLLFAFGFPAAGVLVPIVFLAASGYFWYQANIISDEIAELSTREEQILSDARAAGIDFEDRGDVRSEINDVRKQQEELEKKNQENAGVLKRELEFDADSMRKVVNQASEELDDHELKTTNSVDIEYNEEEYQEAKEELKKAEQRREKLENQLQNHEEKLQEFRQRANKLDFGIFVGEKLDLEIKNLDALDKLENKLDEFITTIEKDAEASRIAINVFDEIQEEEKEETAELFEEGSRATEIFRKITDGRYEKVTYDNEKNQLQVVKSTGEIFTPQELSDGTKDQLYLAIRVALGEELLEGNPGFFVMDDAFLTSDRSRLQTQAQVVEKLAEEGWQIIYLSSKEDAISELSERSEADVVELETLE